MRVDRIQSYNMRRSQSQSFGMLKIKPEALPDLKQAPSEVIRMIDLVGEEIKNITNPTMEITKKLRPRLIFEDGTVLSGKPTPLRPNIWSDKKFHFGYMQEPNVLTGLPKTRQRQRFFYTLPSYKHAVSAYKQMKGMTPIERTAAIVKLSENIYDFTPKSKPATLIDKAEQLFAKYSK